MSKKKIYTIATAHLDTVWNWDFEYVIETCLKKTLLDNFALFEKYPEYKFNFEGAYRYELFEEYYPEYFKRLCGYIEQGRWSPCGSSYENGDVNVPSPEQLFRNIMYGKRYFESRFNKPSNDIFLPDCFGFGWALPSIASYSGLKGFSTQKLSWGSAYGTPFDIGLWYGVGSRHIFASLDSRSYCTEFKKIRGKADIEKKLSKNSSQYNLDCTVSYHGVGDVGGAPKEKSVEVLCEEIRRNDSSDTEVLSSFVTDFFEDLSKLDSVALGRLPRWNNELVMTNHGVGSYTSRAFSKRCNRRCEELADMAERSCVEAMALCGEPYPQKTLEKAWKRLIAHSFHDDITGTSVERAYQRSWNDYIQSLNQFSACYEGAGSAVVRNMDTSWTRGVPFVVCNSIEQDRYSAVDIVLPSAGFKYVRVFDSERRELPSQVNYADDKIIRATVLVRVKSLGYKVIDVLYSYEPCKLETGLAAGENMIENFKYIVKINRRGDICSIIDKSLGNVELLSSPIRYELNKYDGDKDFPAWELKYKEIKKYPWEFAERGVCTVEEQGAARVTLKVSQVCGKSEFTYYVSLTAGGKYVSVYNEIEWREFRRILHNGFNLTVASEQAVFDLGLGAISRPKANKKLYAVPAQRWVDISNKERDFGVSVFSDSKYGWIMKNEHCLRMTVIHSPKHYYRHDSVQGMLDFGRNRYGYAIYSHSGDYKNGTQLNARDFCQPMAAFLCGKHDGVLTSEYSFGSISDDSVIVRAIKKAEDSDEIIVRVNEGAGKAAKDVALTLGKGILQAREVYADEKPLGLAHVQDGSLKFSLEPYEVKTFALTLMPCAVSSRVRRTEVQLEYNASILTENSDPGAAAIPTIDVSVPYELYPESVNCCGVEFKLRKTLAEPQAMISGGQTIGVSGQKLYIIAASLYGDRTYEFTVGDRQVLVDVQAVNEKIGAWDLYNLGETGYIKTDRLAWECTHTHGPNGDNVASQLFFFMYELSIKDAHSVTFPKDNGLIILAAVEEADSRDVSLNTKLYDRMKKRPFDFKLTARQKSAHARQKRRWKKPLNASE